MVFESVNVIESKKDYLNYINVFPVRDADTGNNLYNTLNNAKKIRSVKSLKKFMHELKSVIILSARGNSGVIISQFYKGFCDYLMNYKKIGANEFANAIKEGYAQAYASINKPVEGTMLTVLKGAASGALKVLEKTDSVIDVLLNSFDSAQEYLKKTVNQLPVLKEAGVVDAGGLGVVYILGAWLRSVGVVPEYDKSLDNLILKKQINRRISEKYCVNLLIKNCEHKKELTKLLRNFCTSIQTGEERDLLRLHLHTNESERVKSSCSAFGEVLEFKKEDMRIQYETAKNKSNR